MNTAAHIISNDIDEQVLQTLVPVNVLTADHLATLLRDQSIEAVCQGERLFTVGDYDRNNVYLLSGQVSIVDSLGLSKTVSADHPDCRYPLVDHQPRRHTVIAESDCSVIRFDSVQLDSMLAWDQASHYIMLDISAQRDLDEDADWMLTLLRSNLFYKVPPINIRQVLNKFSADYVSAGEVVIRQGELGDCCYFIKEGVAGVYNSADDKEQPVLLAELEAGRCFGEDALVNQVSRNATVKMHENGVLMRLDKQDFYLLLKTPAVDSVNLEQAKQLLADGGQWIDVRSQDEFDKGHYPSAIHMPLNLLKLKSRMLDQQSHYLIYCNSGRRSEAAAYLLGEDGYSAAALHGGINTCSPADQSLFEQSSL
jgi:rhodanese-related sulfurtransferase